tara:strand:- start:20806 stop:21480 length:675 start_codon:yes stop_codon:yes gene_type:complete
MDDILHDVKPSWLELFDLELLQQCLDKAKASQEKTGKTLCPKYDEILNAFKYFEVEDLKCVIIGQDPYHTPGVAHGLCFSQTISDKTKLKSGKQKIPPSLKNIYKALVKSECIKEMPAHGFLENWAKQGVLMLNAYLTTFEGVAGAHPFWKAFTKDLLSKLDTIVLVWGAKAKALIETKTFKGELLYWGHPSPLARSKFEDCDHFIKVNEILEKKGKIIICWDI